MLPIIIAAYNRPKSLTRLLSSLESATFPDGSIDLYISIDYSGNQECESIAKKFDWRHGKKTVIPHQEHLGLVAHIKNCGTMAAQLGAAIVLEDDLVVSPIFYEYSIKALEFYKTDPKIAGISLYSYSITETAFLPFFPIHNEFDNYFIQVASSWGQIWTTENWDCFCKWWDKNPELEASNLIPEHLLFWGENSWKKHFNCYLIAEEKYFVYPKVSLSTNFEDIGTNASTKGLYQAALALEAKEYVFDDLANSINRYDAWFELEPNCVKAINPELRQHQFGVDLYGTKKLNGNDNDLWITSKAANNAKQSWSNELYPVTTNIILNIAGSELKLAALSDINSAMKVYPNAFFRTQTFRSYQGQANEKIKVLIPFENGDYALLMQTLESISKANIDDLKALVLVGAQASRLESFRSNSSVSLVYSQKTNNVELIEEGLNLVNDGIALVLNPGDKVLPESLSAVSAIFTHYSDVFFLKPVGPNQKGFIPFLNRENCANSFDKAVSLNSIQGVFIRKSSASRIDLAKLSKPHFIAKKLIEQRVSIETRKAEFMHPNKKTLSDHFVQILSSIGARFTRSIWPHVLFNIHFDISDTFRFDEKNKTWYRSRF